MADEGKNIAARNLLDLEPTAVLDFFKLVLDPSSTPEGFPAEIPFHAGNVFKENIIWQGVKYVPLSVETEGFEMLGDRRLPRPRIRVANDNQLITYLLQNNNDLVNAKVIRKKAFIKNLDDANFDGGNPWGQANASAEILDETWLMGRKTHESKVMVEFELNSPLDLESFSVNSRAVVSKYCAWQYRGEGCRYKGVPIERDDGSPFTDVDGATVIPNLTDGGTGFYNNPDYHWNAERTYTRGNVVVVPNKKIMVPPYNGPVPADPAPVGDGTEPVKTCYICVSGNKGQRPELNPTYWQKDGCTKHLYACKKRFNETNEVKYLIAETKYLNSFNAIEFSGNSNLTSDDTSTAGAFYSLEATGTQQDLTGILTGTFTIAGWAKDSPSSSNLSAIWSTTPRGLSQEDVNDEEAEWPSGDSVQFINLARQGAYYRDGEWFTPTQDSELNMSLYQTVGISDGLLPNPIDGSAAVNNVESSITTVAEVNDQWKFFVITNQGPETEGWTNEGDDTELQIWVNSSEDIFERTVDAGLLGQEQPTAPKFANLTSRQTPYGNFAGLPEQFMFGSIVSGSVHPTMNGLLGPWAIWRRQLRPEERKFLYKHVINPEDETAVNYAPRPYSECVGIYADITGKDLVAWWDMTTGQIPSTTNTGLVDIHSGLYWLTGSGYFTPTVETSTYIEYETANNFSDKYPRYGGFPGTDGYGF